LAIRRIAQDRAVCREVARIADQLVVPYPNLGLKRVELREY